MSLFSRLERALGRFAIPDLSLYLVLGQVMVLGFALLGHFNVERIALLPVAVLAGEVWRPITFIFVPPALSISMTSAIFLAFAWYLFYLMGNALEQYWGVFHYNAFLVVGWALTVAASFVTPATYASNAYIAGTVFLAFAYLNPDFVMYIFFILPVRIKWLALIAWIGYGYAFLVGAWSDRLMILASIGNFLLFFAADIVTSIRSGKRRMAWQAHSFSSQNHEREARHTCRICGKTDVSHPQMDFRYCSKCAGDECYCAEHIHNHEHVTAPPAAQ
ncbi:MAG TPA: hypothetical protein VG936_18025 [Lacunisphaera sp.]|nr:hypothetical protein [Lacunisphaera sp.]